MTKKKNLFEEIKGFFLHKPSTSHTKAIPTAQLFKRLLVYLGKNKIFLYGIFFMLVLATLLNAAKPLILGHIIDFLTSIYGKANSSTENGVLEKVLSVDFSHFYTLLIYLVITTSLAGVCQYIQGYISGSLQKSLIFNLRRDVFNKLAILPLAYNEKNSHGDLISRVINDTDNVANVLCQHIGSFFSSIISIVSITAIMLYISPLLALLIYLCVPLSIIFTKILSKRMRTYYRKKHECLGILEGNIEEVVYAYETLLAYNQRERIINKFKKINEDYRDISIKSGILSNFVNPLLMLLSGITYVVVVFVGSILTIKGLLTIGAIQTFLLYIRQITMPLNSMASTYAQIQTAFASAERFFAIYDAEQEEDLGSQNPSNMQGDIELSNISFAYPFKLKEQEAIDLTSPKFKQKFGSRKKDFGPPSPINLQEELPRKGKIKKEEKPLKNVLEDFNLHIKAGQKIAIVGETGCGKTSIINLITRFYTFQKGSLKIDGLAINEYSLEALRRNIALVLQDPFFFSGTIRDNILYSLDKETMHKDASQQEEAMINAAKSANAHDFIIQLPENYDTVLSVDANNISAGQKQLLALTRAFMKNSPILILDEATAHIDTLTEMQIQKAILNLMENRTCIVIAHRLSTIINMDCIVMLDKGKIIEMGTHEELLNMKGKYYSLYYSNSDGEKIV